MILPLLALLQLANMDARVEYSGIARLPVIVAEIEKTTGQKLRLAKNVEEEVLAVFGEPVPAKTLLDRIANVVEAEWQKNGDELTLVRTLAIEKRHVGEHRRLQRDRIANAINAIPNPQAWRDGDAAKVAAQIKARNEAGEALQGYYGELPPQRFANRLIRSVPIDFLLPAADGERVVYSFAPNSAQRPLPESARSIFEQLIKESRDIAAAGYVAPEVGAADKVLLIAHGRRPGRIDLSVRTYNPKGYLTSQGTQVLILGPDRRAMANEATVATEAVLSLSSMSAAFLERTTSLEIRKPSVDLLSVARSPLKHDPLEFVNAEALAAIASHEKKPIVALLPDQIVTSLPSLGPRISRQRYERFLAKHEVVRRDEGGWISYRPTDPSEVRSRRLNRAWLQGLLDEEDRVGHLTLDFYSAHILKSPNRVEGTIYFNYGWVCDSEPPWSETGNNYDPFRLYGLLSPQQKESLSNGAKLNPADMSESQRDLALRLVKGMIFTYVQRNEAGSIEDQEQWLELEPTEAFPKGLSEPFALTARVSNPPICMVRLDGARANGMEAESVGMILAENAKPGATRREMQFAAGTRVRWEFVLHLSKQFHGATSINSDITASGEKFGPYETLPTKFRSLAEVTMKEIQDAAARRTAKGTPPPNP